MLAFAVLLTMASALTCQAKYPPINITGFSTTDIVCEQGDNPKCAGNYTGFSLPTGEHGCLDTNLTVHLGPDVRPHSGQTICRIHGCLDSNSSKVEFQFHDGASYLYPCGSNEGITASCENPGATCEDSLASAVPPASSIMPGITSSSYDTHSTFRSLPPKSHTSSSRSPSSPTSSGTGDSVFNKIKQMLGPGPRID